ncbi:MAG TPA: molybdopterin-dependent oxidoreductase, partial [Burkholderiales bacterium]|nr:molybdopterin-dependent oxidoreductase [Burkholderiales bacterium]
EKRVVFRKELGPLVAAEEMSRCIQCTRCVRFGQEIGGVMELGLAGRGENAEIVSFVGKAVDSELSGNMIDLCPVGALTSEPFRYKARTWELTRRRSIAPHDSLGSNLVVQVKQNRVMRVLPLENEEINECWLSDKDRFSYEGLNSPDRLTRPMVKRDGQWHEVDWEQAFDVLVPRLKGDFGVLASPHSTLEELFLVGKLGNAADFRLRQSDFSGKFDGIPWLGMPVSELQKLDRVLVIGSFLRKDHPLIAHRLRQAAKRGAQIHVLHSVDDDWLMPVASKKIVPPSEIAAQVSSFKEILAGGKNAAVFLGNFARQHPQAAQIHAAAQALGVKLGVFGEAANSVGGYVAGLPTAGGMPAVMTKNTFLLLNVEPELDCADSRAAQQALKDAAFVVSLTSWKTNLEYADVLLPIAPFSEAAGTFVSTEGRVQNFHACVNPLGDTRPGWKVLRVLGSLLGRQGFDFDTIEQVRAACLGGRDVATLLSNRIDAPGSDAEAPQGVQRIADIPIYFADPLVRRSPPLQKTRDARPPRAWMNSRLMAKLGVAAGQPVLANGAVKLMAALDDKLPEDCVRIAAGHPTTAAIGPMFGAVTLANAAAERAA